MVTQRKLKVDMEKQAHRRLQARELEDSYFEGDDAYDDGNDDNRQWFNDDRVYYLEMQTRARFWEIFHIHPSEYNADQWGFFAAIMTMTIVFFYCVCTTCILPCFRRKSNDTTPELRPPLLD